MNLNNFEDHIDSIILARGFDCYTAGHVISLVETGEQAYRAKVEGTELYTVVVEFDKQAGTKGKWVSKADEFATLLEAQSKEDIWME